MSWGPISVKNCSREVVGEELRVAMENYFHPAWDNSETLAESMADAKLGISAALILVKGDAGSDGLVGTGNVDVTINGHSNLDHGKQSGWANESVYIRVEDT